MLTTKYHVKYHDGLWPVLLLVSCKIQRIYFNCWGGSSTPEIFIIQSDFETRARLTTKHPSVISDFTQLRAVDTNRSEEHVVSRAEISHRSLHLETCKRLAAKHPPETE